MNIPEGFDYGDLTPYLKLFFIEMIEEVEEDGYFTITKIQKFKDKDIAVVNIRSKDPIMSTLKRCSVDTKLLKFASSVFSDKVIYNFDIHYNELYLPKSVSSETFDFVAPNDILNIKREIINTPPTPVEIIWKLAKIGCSFIFDNCACVSCDMITFGYDSFSINVSYIDNGVMKTVPLIMLDNGEYKYTDVFVVPKASEVMGIMTIEDIIGHAEIEIVHDDLGREFEAYKLNLKKFEKNVYNSIKFEKIYDRDYTLTVIDRMYDICSYLNGMNLILRDLDKNCKNQLMELPSYNMNRYSVEQKKQNNTFTIQNICYSMDIIEDVSRVYKNNRTLLREYLKSKDESKREELYSIFEEECDRKYGNLLHYFVNGVLDALGIQKGDKYSRIRILTDYINTVHREFVMYGCYFYDLRTTFLRNNFRIEKEFSSTVVMNGYNGCYFRVG